MFMPVCVSGCSYTGVQGHTVAQGQGWEAFLATLPLTHRERVSQSNPERGILLVSLAILLHGASPRL